jgi:hypothetical protein
MAHNFNLNMLMGDLEAAVNRDEVDISLLRSIQAELDVYTAIIQELGGILAQYALREERELYFQGYGWNTQKIEGQERVKIRDAAKHLLQECPGISQNKAAKTIANYCWCNRGVSTIKKHIKDLFANLNP